jgi:hypothetical protein
MIQFTILVAVIAVVSLLSSNPRLTAAALLSLMAYAVLVWRRGEPPIFFFALFSQWTEVATVILQADAARQHLNDYSMMPEMERAVWLGLAGLLVLAVGMRVGLRRLGSIDGRVIMAEVSRFSIPRIFFFHVATFSLSLVVKGMMWMTPRLAQILLAFFNMKWVFFFLLAYVSLLRREKRWMLFVSFVLEVAFGMISFFSEFKQPFFVLIIVYLSLGRRFSKARIFKAALLSVVVFFLGIMWSSVKSEYRNYINEGTGEQVATVSVPERISKILSLYSNLEFDTLDQGTDQLLKRISYVEFFAITLYNVPAEIPHENGKLLGAALMHVLMPRLFFPDKPIVDQTELTSRYTGLEFGENTSVSLGYMAEAYIDFGMGMFIPVFVLGWLWGTIYKLFVTRARVKIFGYIFACPVLLLATVFGTNQVILIGGVLMSFFVMMAVMRLGSPMIDRWLSTGAR